MNTIEKQKMAYLPFKSLAGALLLSIFFGPIGLLYASTLGGIVMIILGCITVSSLLPVPMIIIWLGSCIWSVVATNDYNKRINNKRINKKINKKMLDIQV